MRAESQARTGIRAFLRLDSDVEPQESRIHLSVRDAACSRLVLRFSPLLSREKEREANGYENAYQNGYENSGRFHVILLRTVYTRTDLDALSRFLHCTSAKYVYP